MFDDGFTDPTTSVAHRPWPIPRRPWMMTQRWSDLLFMHWPVPADVLRRLVPHRLQLDLRQGTAWLTVTPLYLSHLRLRGVPTMPGVSAFPEINVRTYVTHGGKPGVFFFSLDAGSSVAVMAARLLFHLPYQRAQMTLRRRGDGAIEYRSQRRTTLPARFDATYAPDGPAHFAEPGSLDHWLSERYCLYSVSNRGTVYRAEIHHFPWPLQRARADTAENTMVSAAGLAQPTEPPRLAFARRLDVVVWDKDRVD